MTVQTPKGEASGAMMVTPEMRRQDDRRRRRHARRHQLTLLWARTGYRPWQRLLHRFDVCHMSVMPLRDGDYGQWIVVRCGWCGVQGKRLDMERAVGPTATTWAEHAKRAKEQTP